MFDPKVFCRNTSNSVWLQRAALGRSPNPTKRSGFDGQFRLKVHRIRRLPGALIVETDHPEMFENESGVIVIGCATKMRKRRHRKIQIRTESIRECLERQ